MKLSLSWKWLIASLCIESLMLSVLVYRNVQQLSESLLVQTSMRLETQKTLLQSALIAPWLQMDYATIQSVLEESQQVQSINYLVALNTQSQPIASVGWPLEKELPPVNNNPFGQSSLLNERYDTSIDIVVSGQKLGSVRIGLSTLFYTQARYSMIFKSIVIALIEIFFSALLLITLNRWIIRNLTKLTQSANAIAQGDYSKRLELSGDQETATLACAFNAMANTIQERIRSLEEVHQEEKKLSDKLERIAHYDTLTNLPNRVLLADRLHQAMAQSNRHNRSLAIIYLDLDGFKSINDTYGHHIGDILLVTLAGRMEQILREGDTLSRIGGDEFVIVLNDIKEVKLCELILERLLHVTNMPVIINDISVQVSSSIGVTFYPQDGASADQLMRHADQAMYLAKQSGKNSYRFFDLDQNVSLQAQRDYFLEVANALAHKEFVLYYQPKVNMKTGEIIGAEALIRWEHPQKGLVMPLSFLPFLENHSLSIEIGEWVIHSALSQIGQWQKIGFNLPVSININAYQLQQNDFMVRFKAILEAHSDVDPSLLEVEILETSAVEDIVHVSAIMQSCHALGVHFALDDFGTGYSSLTYLKRLPAKTLKIDQSFIHDMLDDPDDLAIIEGVLGLARAFRKNVIAEGVESVDHGLCLLALGCEFAQGYGIAEPMPPQEFLFWVEAWKPDARWMAWQNRVPNSDSMQWLFAAVEHNAWVKSLKNYIQEGYGNPPLLNEHLCRFGLWFDREIRGTCKEELWFKKIDSLHHRLHTLGTKLVNTVLAQKEHAITLHTMSQINRMNKTMIALLYERIYSEEKVKERVE
ncbi:EAL domain-containing protein [Sulfurospirillum diekertiae]|uniref:Signaling protein n=1 Tax=Sulfurospirillum diekertiae TaxID=1854492 RepID=A0A1Y0HJL6_9BACT|nr:EAL domain-containing protein [Sulfurospirillum diekertiae]ARU48258.1 putative signaling protein [Sulfurospirillum diekertiae]ASC93101.1 putative signaling protein [Sulfurospirillum diekertiae]